MEMQQRTMAEASGEARKANTLLRQQLVGTQAATVTLGLSLYPNNMLSVTFDQRGTAAARNVCFSFSAVRKTIPSLTDIGGRVNHTACEAVLSDKVFQGPHEYGLPALTPAVMEAIRRTEETVMAEGELSYDNGFVDVRRGKACLYW